jgi:hypothetical protein
MRNDVAFEIIAKEVFAALLQRAEAAERERDELTTMLRAVLSEGNSNHGFTPLRCTVCGDLAAACRKVLVPAAKEGT